MPTPPASDVLAGLDRSLQHLSDSLQAKIGVAFRDLETGREYCFNEKTMLHAASTMKVAVMIEVFRQAEAGRFQLSDSLPVRNQFISIVDGSPYSLELEEDSDDSVYAALGGKMPILELVRHMITLSSNLATNLLIELVRADSVMHTLHRLGIHELQVLRGVEDRKAYERGLNNRTNARALMLCLQAIAEGRAASPAGCQAMIAIMREQKFRQNIPAGVPPGFWVANKTGSITAIDHDCAIIGRDNRNPVVLAILTHGIATHQQASETIAGITRLLFDKLVPSIASNRPPAQ
ncbi:MAG: class A beta-lactamase-related serine hydrolase [candidate division KSB1 bacterium]|nr:class A beta-lactamase-related serine hydrolase [candidate division KSB1 bacterium]MDZ7273369.1 class A beta-lactamase-related serine hydrolase [candidate division KSB1 bacterium]MDZ7288031.1 class A beta-lactamase-related serine hydrolase [candidate division KSB1 bacterium]MDZ7300117.1 class A beta-lactamase-related serine hydrolase [candidate division KSB1 bacterium]MDZ7308891.1 class A beta-lactamase-related serine hydrolase [candidate division KSB1 bacterium]